MNAFGEIQVRFLILEGIYNDILDIVFTIYSIEVNLKI